MLVYLLIILFLKPLIVRYTWSLIWVTIFLLFWWIIQWLLSCWLYICRGHRRHFTTIVILLWNLFRCDITTSKWTIHLLVLVGVNPTSFLLIFDWYRSTIYTLTFVQCWGKIFTFFIFRQILSFLHRIVYILYTSFVIEISYHFDF